MLCVCQLGNLRSGWKSNLLGRYLDPDPLARRGKVAASMVIRPVASLTVGNEVLALPRPVLPRIVCIELQHDLAGGIFGIQPDVGKKLLAIAESDRFATGIHDVLDEPCTRLTAGDFS